MIVLQAKNKKKNNALLSLFPQNFRPILVPINVTKFRKNIYIICDTYNLPLKKTRSTKIISTTIVSITQITSIQTKTSVT